MNFKRAIWIGIAVYIATFLLGATVSTILGFDMTSAAMGEIPLSLWLTSAIIAVLLSVLAALWYFRPAALKPSAKSGFHFGLTLMIVGFILDFLLFLPLISQGQNPFTALLEYYKQPIFWMTLVLILAGTASVGAILERRGKA